MHATNSQVDGAVKFNEILKTTNQITYQILNEWGHILFSILKKKYFELAAPTNPGEKLDLA